VIDGVRFEVVGADRRQGLMRLRLERIDDGD